MRIGKRQQKVVSYKAISLSRGRIEMDSSPGMSYLQNQTIKASHCASVEELSIMRVVMSSGLDWSENFLIFHIIYDSCWVILEAWLSGSEPTIISRSGSAIECKKGPQVLTSLLNQRRNYYYYIIIIKLGYDR